MARRRSRTLTEMELEIMKIAWEGGEVTVGDIRRAFEDKAVVLALPTIRTMLGILVRKGYLLRAREGRGHVYEPLVSEPQARRSFLDDILDRVFGGSARDLVASLLDAHRITRRELDQVKRLIREHERRRPS